MRIPEARIEELLETWPVARLATVGPDRTPHLVPIVFARIDSHLFTPIDGKPKGSAVPARIQNVRGWPRVAVLLDEYVADWRRLWWLRIEGNASVLTPADPEGDPATAPAVARLRAKYPQYGDTPLFRGAPTLIRVRITALRSWCASALC
jgi:PPOX class probable F420-dependent enzyme